MHDKSYGDFHPNVPLNPIIADLSVNVGCVITPYFVVPDGKSKGPVLEVVEAD